MEKSKLPRWAQPKPQPVRKSFAQEIEEYCPWPGFGVGDKTRAELRSCMSRYIAALRERGVSPQVIHMALYQMADKMIGEEQNVRNNEEAEL